MKTKKSDKDLPKNKISTSSPGLFVLEMPLRIELWQADIIDKRYDYLRMLYNYVQNKLLKQYIYFSKSNEYHNIKTYEEKREFFKSHPFTVSGITGRGNIPLQITFTEYGIKNFVTKLCKRNTGEKTYKDLGINTTNLSALGSNIWAAWYEKLYGYSEDGKESEIRFKGMDKQNSLEYGTILSQGKKVFIGLNIDLTKLIVELKVNGSTGSNARWISMSFGDGKSLSLYESEALSLGLDSLRTVSIIRKFRNGKRKYYIQLTFKGKSYGKGRQLGTGRVGIDVGPSTVAICSDNVVRIDKLAINVDNMESKIADLQRLMDKSKRATNPQNFNADGTVKQGKCLKWYYSKRYVELRAKKKEIQRHQAAVRKAQHIEMANYILSLGNEFIVENNPVKEWTARDKETKKDEKTGKFKSKKRFGKSVGNHAPSEFITILKNKVLSLGGKFVVVDTRNAATQFDFTNGTFTPHSLNERRITFSNGDDHQVDMIAAFNLQHLIYDSEKLKQYDIESMKEHYASYCVLEREELNMYLKGIKKNDKYTIGAF